MTSLPFDPESAALAWQRLRFALGAAGLGTWHLDLRTGVATHDENFNRILGVGAMETTGRLEDPGFTQIHQADRDRVIAAIADAVTTQAEYNLEFRVVRRDGMVRWLRDRGRVILDDRGTALFATGAVMDVTEQRRAEHDARILAADNGATGAYVVGPAVKDWRGLDYVGHEVKLLVDGRDVGQLKGEMRPNCIDVLVWTANEMSRRGVGLKAGDVISTGAAAAPYRMEQATGKVVADFGKLGRVEAEIG